MSLALVFQSQWSFPLPAINSSAREGTHLPGFDFDEALPASADPKVSAATLEKAEKVMHFLTCACKRVWDASLVPPGEQYSWNEIWRMRAEDRYSRATRRCYAG